MTEETRLEPSRPTLENSVSIAYATKCLAPYLYITPSEPPQKSFGERVIEIPYTLVFGGIAFAVNLLEKTDRLFNKKARESYQQDQQKLQEDLTAREEDDRQFFAEYGAETQQEKDVCEILFTTRMSLRRSLRNENIERFPLAELSDYLHKHFLDGMSSLSYRYGADAVERHFQKTAVAWLKEEITKRHHSGPVEILDAVTLQQEGDFFYIK